MRWRSEMTKIHIRKAEATDASRLNAALRALSDSMGDTHRASDAIITSAGFGPVPAFHALLAEQGAEIVGVAVCSPLFSTTRGVAGAYVSDLWVSDAMRGQGLGPRLLAAARDHGKALWGAAFLRLAVYGDNPRAQDFYIRLGFDAMEGDIWMTLEGKAFDDIGDQE